jgi:hypothetical protein
LLRHPSECMPGRAAPGTAATRDDWRATCAQQYGPHMNRLRTLLTRLKGGPPTGPLTTVEQTDADELREQTLAKDNERIAGEQKKKDRRASNGRG